MIVQMMKHNPSGLIATRTMTTESIGKIDIATGRLGSLCDAEVEVRGNGSTIQ